MAEILTATLVAILVWWASTGGILVVAGLTGLARRVALGLSLPLLGGGGFGFL